MSNASTQDDDARCMSVIPGLVPLAGITSGDVAPDRFTSARPSDRGSMMIMRFAGSTARAPRRTADNDFHHDYLGRLGWWKRSLLRDIVVAVVLLAAVGAALSVGPFALELVAFH